MTPLQARTGFSLVELLVVLAILAILGGMISYNFATPETRRQATRLAAEELAATFRKARTLAMERKSTHGVFFHIQNEPGSTGAILNNRSGGHWYRILGSNSGSAGGSFSHGTDDLPAISTSGNYPRTVYEIREMTRAAWVDEPHVLPPKKVRFLALSDMDYSGMVNTGNGNYRYSSATNLYYPRPWFGRYDPTTKKLYAWGGYNGDVAAIQATSGFYYWGETRTTECTADPQPVGCKNPVTRTLSHFSGNNTTTPIGAGDVLYEAGSPRPLLDGEIRDCGIIFLANGETRWAPFMAPRHCNTSKDRAGVRIGLYDRCNIKTEQYTGAVNPRFAAEAGNFDADSGGWFITLAPDSTDDQEIFASASDALRSMSPMYRVFVSTLGEVRVIAVSNKENLNGLTAFPPNSGWWANTANVQKYFPNDRYVTGTKLGGTGEGIGIATGRPITDFVTTTMLTECQVWMK